MQCLIYGYVATYDLNDVPYAVLDQDRSTASRDLLAGSTGRASFIAWPTSIAEPDSKTVIDERRALLVIQIDQDFERQLDSGAAGRRAGDRRRPQFQHRRRPRWVTSNAIVESFNADWRAEPTASGNPPIQVSTRAWYNPNLETRWNMIPSLIGTLTMLQTLLLTAMSVAREREQGTFDQLLVTPFRPAEIMAGKALPSMLIGMMQATNDPAGGPALVSHPLCRFVRDPLCRADVFLLAAVGIGLLVSSIAATMQQAMLYSFVVMMPFALLSGLTTPISSMPQSAAIADAGQSAALRDRHRPARLSRGCRPGTAGPRSLAAGPDRHGDPFVRLLAVPPSPDVNPTKSRIARLLVVRL